MGLFGSITRALIGGKRKNSPQQDTSKPFHTHSSKKNDTAVSAGTDMGPKGGDSRFDLGDRNDSFMGKGQVENFSNLTDTSAVDRGGRAVDSSALDPVGIKPAMNPSLATPVDIDEQGINSLY